MNESEKLRVSFKGSLGGSINIHDLVATLFALNSALGIIYESEGHVSTKKKLCVDVNAFKKGSFDTDLLIYIKDIAESTAPLLPLVAQSQTFSTIKSVLNILKSALDVRKFLKGKPAKEVTIEQSGKHPIAHIYNFNGEKTEVNISVYNVLQDKKFNAATKKMVEPLSRKESQVETIELLTKDNKPKTTINRSDVPAFENIDELQSTKNYELRGVVTALDRKTSNGKISVGPRRVNFEVADNLMIEQYNKFDDLLIESLRLKIALLFEGEAALDHEGNVKKIKIQNITPEVKII